MLFSVAFVNNSATGAEGHRTINTQYLPARAMDEKSRGAGVSTASSFFVPQEEFGL
jgi:hypothetical protein